MEHNRLQLFTKADLNQLTNYRSGEIKFGERVHILEPRIDWHTDLAASEAPFVLIGLPEDVGVKANFGRPGAATAWESFLKSFLNVQHNRFCKGSWITILGHLNFEHEMNKAATLDPSNREDKKKLYDLVADIDKEVTHIISKIVRAGKIPIIIGGGHNNAYGNIKGTALAKGKHINAINFDAHTDFRPLEGRHSGNGFSYAFEEGFLKNYFVFGLHESYTSKTVFSDMKANNLRVQYNTYEQIKIRKEKSFDTELIAARKHIDSTFFGIEIDLDSIPNIASSAITPSGFQVEDLRQFIHFFGQSKNAAYLHICEGAPTLDFPVNNHVVGKLIAYLVTDFMKANTEKI